jgi:hypothetical protein
MISELYKPEALKMDYLTLLAECESTFDSLKVSDILVSENKDS